MVVAEAGSILVSPDGVMARWMATAIIGAHTLIGGHLVTRLYTMQYKASRT